MTATSSRNRTDEVNPLDLVSPHYYGEFGPPHKQWSWLRDNEPVYWCDPPGFEHFWAITRHEDIIEVSSQPDVFSNEAKGIVVLNDQQVADRTNNQSPLSQMRTIITMDPPEHRLYRKLASGFFTPKGIGGLDALVARADANAAVIDRFVQSSPWLGHLATDAARRSNTSVCLKLSGPKVTALDTDAQAALLKKFTKLLDDEGVANDIGSYRDAPPGLRIWCGATVEKSSLEALTPWLDWAWAQVNAG